MRHGKKFNHLGRTASHRKAMLSNMASSLIIHKRINTTVAKAKALRKYVEPLITKAKEDSTHSRRTVFSYLQDKESTHELFANIAEKVANRPGGYTRILKTGARLGDNAEMCVMELVDYNDLLLGEDTAKSTKRSRRGKKKTKAEYSDNVATEAVETEVEDAEVIEETPAEEAVVEDTPVAEESAPEAPADEVKEEETPEAKTDDQEEDSDSKEEKK